ncbi:MAG: hypothetical protein V1866_03635 [archaeon]
MKQDEKKASVDTNGQVVIPPAPSPEKEKLKKSLLHIESNISSASAKIDAVKEETTTTTKTHSVEHELEQHTTHHIIRTTCLIALVLWFFLIIMLSMVTESSPFSTMMGLSPVLFTIIVSYILVDHYHLESGFLMVFPVIFTGIFLLMGMGHMLGGVDYMNLSVVNIVFGLLFEAAITMHHSLLKKHMQEMHEAHIVEEKKTETIVSPEADAAKKELGEVKKELASVKKMIVKLDSEDDVKKFIASIEDKAKAINAVIGRVYSVRHGGTESLRKKIKIDPEHYNEFNELKDQAPNKRKAAAISILNKINGTLDVIEKQEKEVFDSSDLSGLVRLERAARGYDRVIDVLAKNDSDPVKLYYDGAREFCREALSALEAK